MKFFLAAAALAASTQAITIHIDLTDGKDHSDLIDDEWWKDSDIEFEFSDYIKLSHLISGLLKGFGLSEHVDDCFQGKLGDELADSLNAVMFSGHC